MDKIIVLIGPPGAGKGTQARLLQERLGMPQISTGDIFREMKQADTRLGRKLRDVLDSGELVSDELTYSIVRDRTSREDCRGSYILDGYPRTPVQAEQLEELAREQDKEIRAVEISVPRADLMKRLTGRRSCVVCGEIYNIYLKPPKRDNVCDYHPDQPLKHRADDNEESVSTRLENYEELTRPLIDYYKKTDRLERVDGRGNLEEIYRNISGTLNIAASGSAGQQKS